MKFIIVLFSMSLVLLGSCSSKSKSKQVVTPQTVISVPLFNADSAYLYVKTQVNFGPRVPNTKAHDECAAYLVEQMKRFGADVTQQKADLKMFNGTLLHSDNIISSFNPSAKKRILLCAHWDSRPYCDHDPNPANYHRPVLGANDGASGVGVLMEIARQIGKQKPSVGVDIIFFDSEDVGEPDFSNGPHDDNAWCLGTQYWATHLIPANYQAAFGILLDMVGAPNAIFYKEQFSMDHAPQIVDKVWNQAKEYGFSNYFVDRTGGAITDDHLFVNRLAGIPCIDIIQQDLNSPTGFAPYWHTTHDTMANIDRNTLLAVGQTLLGVIYNEKP
ncbi:MAG: M28 family peptidase [Microbacter sp.]